MNARALRCLLWLVVLSAAGCQSPSAPSAPGGPNSTPGGQTPAPAVSVRSVTVTGPGGRGTSFTPGETLQFTAAATLSDGRTEDCTSSAVWTTTAPAVVRPAERPGQMAAVAVGEATVLAACGGQVGTLSITVKSGIRIIGLEAYVPFMLTAERPVVTAQVVDAGGQAHACRAAWGTTDHDVAHVDSASTTGVVVSWGEGEATISASCEGQTGTALVRSGTYRLQGDVRDRDTGAPIAGAALQRGLGRDTTTDAEGRYTSQRQGYSPWTWFAWRNGYEVAVQERIGWERQPVVRLDWALARIPGILLEGSGELCWKQGACAPGVEAKRTYAFVVPAAGTLRVDTFWELDYNDLLYHELRCNQEVVAEGSRRDHNWGRLLEVPASPACAYQLSFVQSTRNPVMHFDYTVSWR